MSRNAMDGDRSVSHGYADLNSETTKKWRDVENPPGLFQNKKNP